jgi:Transposase, Mutator family
MPGDGHVRCGGRARETGREESRHRALVRSHVVKIRDGQVANRPVYAAIGVSLEGGKDVLGLWAGTGGEGAKFWMSVLLDLKNRGVRDVFFLVCDGLKGLPAVVANVWPQTTVQTCIIHYPDTVVMPAPDVPVLISGGDRAAGIGIISSAVA